MKGRLTGKLLLSLGITQPWEGRFLRPPDAKASRIQKIHLVGPMMNRC